MTYVVAFLVAAILSVCISRAVHRFAKKRAILDVPNSIRKFHARPTPLLGGVALYLAWLLVVFGFSYVSPVLLGGGYEVKHLVGIAVAGAILMVGGILDDRFSLKPLVQTFFPLIAIFVVIGSGIGIKAITNPFGGVIALDRVAGLFTLLWLAVCIYAFKLFDGVDGLASSVGLVGSIITFFVSLRYPYHQTDAAFMAIIFAGTLLGFLVLNFPPARLFLGDGGSVWIGFMVGLLAILSGSKIATALLIIAFPLVDVLYVTLRRIFVLKKSPFVGDREHLHFRLLDLGLSPRGVVFIFAGFALLFGGATLLFSSFYKAILLASVFAIAISFELFVTRKTQSKTRSPV